MTKRRGAVSTGLGLCAALLAATVVRAQPLPSTPLSLAGGRIVLGGDVAVSAGENDDLAYFNYTDYEHDALRMLRLSVLGEWRVVDRLAVLGEIRSENADQPRAYALYVRLRPWRDRPFDVQAGRIPPVFGAFARRVYGSDNPLIGYPLAYQYLTTLRPDAVPMTADDLLAVRARGWRVQFPFGSPAPRPGVPIVTAFRWDTGVELQAGDGPVRVAAAVTTGTLSSPRVRDDNGGKQVAARLELRPVIGLITGVSAARGAWLSDTVTAALPAAVLLPATSLMAPVSRTTGVESGDRSVGSVRKTCERRSKPELLPEASGARLTNVTDVGTTPGSPTRKSDA